MYKFPKHVHVIDVKAAKQSTNEQFFNKIIQFDRH